MPDIFEPPTDPGVISAVFAEPAIYMSLGAAVCGLAIFAGRVVLRWARRNHQPARTQNDPGGGI